MVAYATEEGFDLSMELQEKLRETPGEAAVFPLFTEFLKSADYLRSAHSHAGLLRRTYGTLVRKTVRRAPYLRD